MGIGSDASDASDVADVEFIGIEGSTDNEEEDSNLEEGDYEFVANQKGGLKFFSSGYGYHKLRITNQFTSWRCDISKGSKCSATAKTIELPDGSHKVIRVNMNHTHPPDLFHKEQLIARNNLKLQALQNANVPANEIVQSELNKNLHLGKYLGTNTQIRAVLGYARRKNLKPMLNEPPEIFGCKRKKTLNNPPFVDRNTLRQRRNKLPSLSRSDDDNDDDDDDDDDYNTESPKKSKTEDYRGSLIELKTESSLDNQKMEAEIKNIKMETVKFEMEIKKIEMETKKIEMETEKIQLELDILRNQANKEHYVVDSL